MGFVRHDWPSSDPVLLAAFRKQVQGFIRAGDDPWPWLLAWDSEPGVTRDDLFDVIKEELGIIPPASERPEPPRPGSVQPSPFT